MDDSDDYIVDDIVFDDKTLAALDQEEKKYLHYSSVTTTSEGPINKRHKTSTGWKPGIGANLESADSYDDLPEISLRVDGSYGIGNPEQPTKTSVTGFLGQDSRYKQSTRAVNNHPLPQNVPRGHASGSSLQYPSKAPPSAVRENQHPPISKATAQEYPDTRQDSPQASTELHDQMLELQKKLEEMRNENMEIQSALKDAVDAKLAKEGEVSILRKNIEKTAQNHAAQLSQLKAERERADLKQTQMQKEMKDEVERLRTQFLFKQQELESAIRKPPGTVRTRKINKDFPSTPLVGSAGRAVWNRDSSQLQVSRAMVDETPVRPRPPHVPRLSPSKPTRKSPEKSRKSAMLPGFENAFDTSTPLRPSLRRDKGKGRADQDLVFSGAVPEIPYMHSQPIHVPFEMQPRFIPSQNLQQGTIPVLTFEGSAAFEPQHSNNEEMDVVQTETAQDAVVHEVEDFEPLNQKAELCRILLTHSFSSTAEISLQKLLSSAHLVSSTRTNSYVTACARILAVLANSTNDDADEQSIQFVCTALLSLLVILHESQQLHLMTILLDLLTKFTSWFSCQSILLSSRPSLKEGQTISIIDLLCHFILEYLDPARPLAVSREFVVEIFSLLESLCFRVPQDSVDQLETLARHKKVLMVLLHSSQQPWFLERSSILLVLLSTHHKLSAALLDCSELKDANSIREYDPRKNPFIERLCSHLIDSTRSPIEEFKSYILVFFSQLSIAHPGAYTELVDTYVLIPSLILYTSQLAAPLWEDDESLLMSSKVAASFVQALNQTMFSLHQLIFEKVPCLDVRAKLHHAPHRPFNGIDHMFVVTFGRLSYCDPPSWLDVDNRQALVYLVDMAREILELVIDGPETDSVWTAFQAEHDEESEIDEGEMEARLMGVEI